MKKVEEIYKRKHFKLFYKHIADYSHGSQNVEIENVMCGQRYVPAHISIKMKRTDFGKYRQHYTYNENVLKDKCIQLVFTDKGQLTKPKERVLFENTPDEWIKWITIYRKDTNFNENYCLHVSYYSALYMFDAISDANKN